MDQPAFKIDDIPVFIGEPNQLMHSGSLTDEEIVAVSLALHQNAPDTYQDSDSTWKSAAKLEAINRLSY